MIRGASLLCQMQSQTVWIYDEEISFFFLRKEAFKKNLHVRAHTYPQNGIHKC